MNTSLIQSSTTATQQTKALESNYDPKVLAQGILQDLESLTQIFNDLDPKKIAAQIEEEDKKKGIKITPEEAEKQGLEEAQEKAKSSYYITRISRTLEDLQSALKVAGDVPDGPAKEELQKVTSEVQSVLGSFVDPENPSTSIMDVANDPEKLRSFLQDVLNDEPEDIGYVVSDLQPIISELKTDLGQS